MPNATLDPTEVDANGLAVRDWLTTELERVKRKINHPLIIVACRQLAASGKPFTDIKAGYWPLHEILAAVHTMTGLDHDQLPGGDLIHAMEELLAEGVLARIRYRCGGLDWRDYDCYRVTADY